MHAAQAGVLLVLMLGLLSLPVLADTHVNGRWEMELNAEKDYPDVYREVALRVTFEGPGGRHFEGAGFWDGGKRFKVRAAFPAAGSWQYTTSSVPGDKGLDGKTGTVEVKPYDGKNPLYAHGFLKVSDHHRYITFGDGIPFLWIGDTAWCAPWNATREDWAHYLDVRTRQGFTLTMVLATREEFMPETKNIAGLTPFMEDGTPNHTYWESVAEKIEMANQKGMVVLLAGLAYGAKSEMYVKQMANREFARYIVGRTMGNFVIYSPSIDQKYIAENDSMGEFVREMTLVHLITQHVGTVFPAAQAYQPKSYLDIAGFQSGHHEGSPEKAYGAAREWARILHGMTPTKPVIDLEGQYDGRGDNSGGNWREKDVRKIGWLTMLSGSMGYIYGAGELEKNVAGANGGVFLFAPKPEAWDYWKKALEWKSAKQMGYMKEFFATIPWWTLEPAQDILRNQVKGEHAKRAVAKSASGDLVVCYSPYRGRVVLDLHQVKAGLKGRWFDPQQGTWSEVAGEVGGKDEASFDPPAGGEDWVLVLEAPKQGG